MAYPLALGAITFFLAVIWGRPLINWLIRNEMGKKIRVEEPGAHQLKMGTPTMGGLMVIIPVVVITGALNIANLLGFNFIGQSVLIPLSTLVSFGLLGLIDDLEGIRGKRAKGEGIMARTKASWQVIFALIIALILYFGPTELRSVAIPGITDRIEIGLLWVPVAALIIVFTSNAVNLTDGLDGLAGSLGGGCLCLLWRYRLPARPGLAGSLLLYYGWLAAGLPVVQRPPGRAVYGRRRLAGYRCNLGSGRPDDRPMALVADCGR